MILPDDLVQWKPSQNLLSGVYSHFFSWANVNRAVLELRNAIGTVLYWDKYANIQVMWFHPIYTAILEEIRIHEPPGRYAELDGFIDYRGPYNRILWPRFCDVRKV